MSFFNLIKKSSIDECFNRLNDFSKDLEEKLNFDTDSFIEEFDKQQKKLFSKFNSFKEKIIKEFPDKYETAVSYDRNTERLTHSIERDGNEIVLKVEVKKLEGDGVKSTTILLEDSNLDYDSLSMRYDPIGKQMIFSFKKNRVANTNSSNVVEEPTAEEAKKITKDEALKKAEALRKLNWTFKRIAQEIGVSERTIRRWLQKD